MKKVILLATLILCAVSFAQEISDSVSFNAYPKNTGREILNVCLNCHGADFPPNVAAMTIDDLRQITVKNTKRRNIGIKNLYQLISAYYGPTSEHKRRSMPPVGAFPEEQFDDCDRERILNLLDNNHQIAVQNCDPVSFE